MEKLSRYRALIKRILKEYAQYKPSYGEIETFVICDQEQDHYQLLFLGWNLPRRVHAIIVHIRLYNNKIWIEYDGTSYGIAGELVDAGVPKEDIVLAFHSREKRPYTEFAVE